MIKWRDLSQSWNPYTPYCFFIVKSLFFNIINRPKNSYYCLYNACILIDLSIFKQLKLNRRVCWNRWFELNISFINPFTFIWNLSIIYNNSFSTILFFIPSIRVSSYLVIFLLIYHLIFKNQSIHLYSYLYIFLFIYHHICWSIYLFIVMLKSTVISGVYL